MKKTILFFILLWSVNCNAQGWQNCGDGITGKFPYENWCFVSSMATDTINNILYVAGAFDTINNTTPVHGIATWNGSNWNSIPILENDWPNFYNDSTNEHINALIFYHNDLYFPCSFTYYYNNQPFPVYYVGKYDGDSFQLLPYLDGPVNCFTVFNDTLYIGGGFIEPDTVAFNHVAKWNGTNWQPVGSGFNSSVLALGVSNGKLYAGGTFDQSGNTTHLLSIAQWEDTAWAPLGRGIADPVDSSREGFVNAIGTYQNNLYVGGDFGFAGGYSANNIAEWNGIEWITLDKGAENTVSAFATYNNKLYVGGAFAIANLPNSNRLDSWDGFNWAGVDSGLNAPVLSLAVFQNSLYVGGQFDSAGNIIANAIARWSPDSTSNIEQISILGIHLTIAPNPFSQQTTLQFSQPINNNAQLVLYNLIGMQVQNYTISSGTKNLIIKRNNLPAGMYFYKVLGNAMSPLAGKVVIE